MINSRPIQRLRRFAPHKRRKYNTVCFRDLKIFDKNQLLDDIESNACFDDDLVQGISLWDEQKLQFRI